MNNIARPYLFVSSRVWLPVALHLSEGQVGAIWESTEEGSWGPVWKSLNLFFHLVFLHAGILAASCQLQWTRLEVIVQLQSINCEITLFCKKNVYMC